MSKTTREAFIVELPIEKPPKTERELEITKHIEQLELSKAELKKKIMAAKAERFYASHKGIARLEKERKSGVVTTLEDQSQAAVKEPEAIKAHPLSKVQTVQTKPVEQEPVKVPVKQEPVKPKETKAEVPVAQVKAQEVSQPVLANISGKWF